MAYRKTRTVVRIVRLAASTLGIATLSACLEPTSVGRPAQVSLSLRPSFSRADAGGGPLLDQVHLVLTRPPASHAIIDTMVNVPPGVDSLAVSLKVPVAASEDHLQASVDLLSGGVVLYHGTSDIIITADQGQSSAPPISVGYVGPGASARSLAIAPRDLSISAVDGLIFSATVLDSLGQGISGVPLIWGTSDPSLATISTTGQLSGTGRRGLVTVYARTLSGVGDSVRVSLLPAPARLLVVNGNAQAAPAGSTLTQPVVVQVDAMDGPAPGVLVDFRAGAPGATIEPTQAITDASGRASAQVVLAKTSGAQAFTATVGGLPPVTLTEMATIVPTAIVRVSGDAQTDSVGSSLKPFVVKVTDAFGNPAPGATVTWTRLSGGGAFSTLGGSVASSSTSNADAQGLASITYTLGAVPGSESVTATIPVGPASVTFSAGAVARGIAKLQVQSGDNQSGMVGNKLALPLVVKAVDALGNPVFGATVKFTAITSGASVAPATVTTDQSGAAAAVITLGPTPGPQQFTVSAGNIILMLSAQATRGSASKLVVVAGNGQVDTVGRTLKPFVVRVTDAFGNPVPGAVVDWSRAAGAGTFATAGGSTSTVADTTGQAGIGYTLGLVPRTDSVRATLTGTAASALFTLTAIQRSIAKIQLVSGDNQSGTAGASLAQPLVVKAVDALGNSLIGIGISFAAAAAGGSVSPATAITDANGAASTHMTLGTAAGAQQFSASSGTVTVTVNASATTPVPTKLQYISGNGQADSACAMLKQALVVRALDASGNVAAGAKIIWSQIGEPEDHTSTVVLATATANSAGVSSLNYHLPNDIGAHTVTAMLDVNHSQIVTFTQSTTRTIKKGCSP